MTTTITVGIGKWSNRGSLTYKTAQAQGVDAYGRILGKSADWGAGKRLPYKIEENGGTTYIMYDDDTLADVAIIKIVEA